MQVPFLQVSPSVAQHSFLAAAPLVQQEEEEAQEVSPVKATAAARASRDWMCFIVKVKRGRDGRFRKKSGRTEKTVPSTLAECTQRVAGEIRRVRLFPGGVAADGGRSWSWSDFFGFASAQGEAGGGNGEKEQGGRFHG